MSFDWFFDILLQIESGVCSISELTKGVFFFFFPTLGLVNFIPVLVNFGVCIVIDEVCENNGPRIVVRSIKRINKGEEVTVAYTDLLQPKVCFFLPFHDLHF